MEDFLEIVRDAESLLADEDQPTTLDFGYALDAAIRGTSYEGRVYEDFVFNEDDVEATYVIFIDGKPAYKAGTCNLVGYPGDRRLGVHCGYYYGVSAI